MLTVSATDFGTPEAVWLTDRSLAEAPPLDLRSLVAGCDRVVVKDRSQRRLVAHVGGNARYRAPGQRLQAGQHRRRAVGEVVEDDRRVADTRQFDDDMRADIARTAGDQNRIRH